MAKKVVIKPQKGSQEVAMQSKADVIIYGGAAGSGKSHLLLMHPLQYIQDPNFQGVFFRRVTKQLIGSGGLWQEAGKMYSAFKTRHRTKPELQHLFPKGSMLSFSHMEHAKNRFDHQGLQYSFIGFDELTHFEESQFTYLLSRLRSDADSKSYCMATCNPDADSWVLKWIEWWLDKEGFPDPEKKGVLRYYVVIDESPVFADSPEELMEKYPESCQVYNPNEDKYVTVPPKSITFIGGTIFDNPILIQRNPNYLAELQALPTVEKARLLHGNWYARAKGANYWDRSWLKKLAHPPKEGLAARGWDKASQEPSEVERQPDFTTSVKIIKTRDGDYVILGDYIEENKDTGDTEIYGKFRLGPGKRDNIIKKQGLYDGEECTIVLPIDPGAAGKSEFTEASKKLSEEGLIVKSDPSPSTKSKLTKFTPFAVACENGFVYIVESSFKDKKSLDAFYKELEAFDGERSTRTKKDDWPDACATTFNFLAGKRVVKIVNRNQRESSSRASQIIKQHETEMREKQAPFVPSVHNR